jgi:hypothetical protein
MIPVLNGRVWSDFASALPSICEGGALDVRLCRRARKTSGPRKDPTLTNPSGGAPETSEADLGHPAALTFLVSVKSRRKRPNRFDQEHFSEGLTCLGLGHLLNRVVPFRIKNKAVWNAIDD